MKAHADCRAPPCAAFLVLFLLWIAYSRLDLTIAKDATWRRQRDRAIAKDTTHVLRTLLPAIARRFDTLDESTTELASGPAGTSSGAYVRYTNALEEVVPLLDEVRLLCWGNGCRQQVVCVMSCMELPLTRSNRFSLVTRGLARGQQCGDRGQQCVQGESQDMTLYSG